MFREQFVEAVFVDRRLAVEPRDDRILHFSPAIFPACRLVQPSNRGEYEISEAIDLLIRGGRTIDAIPLDGWRMDIGYPEDRDEAEGRLQEGVQESVASDYVAVTIRAAAR